MSEIKGYNDLTEGQCKLLWRVHRYASFVNGLGSTRQIGHRQHPESKLECTGRFC
jgi:hypothetical protein